MRILLVSDFFPPVRGGLEAHVDDLAAELAARGHDVHVATLTTNPEPSDSRVQVHVVRTTASSFVRFERDDRPFAPPVPDPGARIALGRLVRALTPDIVHGHSWLAASLPSRQRPPTVFTAHDYATACQLHTLLRTDGERCAGPSFADCVSCGSRRYGRARSLAMTAGTLAGRRLIPADRLLTLSQQVASVVGPLFTVPTEVVPGFVRDIPLPARPPETVPDGPYVMFAGDPGGHKGLELLLSLWAAEVPPGLPLLVASTKELPHPLPPRVTTVTLDRAGVRAAWQNAAVAVVPSRWDEPFGMVAIEALTAGVPVVASRVGALPELVRDGIDGLLVAPGNEAALREALDALVNDETRRAQLSAAAKAGALRFTAKHVVPMIESVYQRTIAERQAAA